MTLTSPWDIIKFLGMQNSLTEVTYSQLWSSPCSLELITWSQGLLYEHNIYMALFIEQQMYNRIRLMFSFSSVIISTKLIPSWRRLWFSTLTGKSTRPCHIYHSNEALSGENMACPERHGILHSSLSWKRWENKLLLKMEEEFREANFGM